MRSPQTQHHNQPYLQQNLHNCPQIPEKSIASSDLLASQQSNDPEIWEYDQDGDCYQYEKHLPDRVVLWVGEKCRESKERVGGIEIGMGERGQHADNEDGEKNESALDLYS